MTGKTVRENPGQGNRPGKLILAATPIGNLEDMTFRAVRMLKEADLIAAEDTRNSIRLLSHFDIHTPMTSYHEYNRIEKAYELAEQIRGGKTVVLITDAGTPGISDPGEDLVRIALENGIEVTSLPGACACITALTISGRKTRRFCFEAFLPSEKKERQEILESLKNETRTIILYEAPHHLKKTLTDLLETLGDRNITLCRELTKIHEEAWMTTFSQALEAYESGEKQIRGEYVLVIEGRSREQLKEEASRRWEEMPLAEHMQIYLKQGMDNKTAMKAVAKDRGKTKREIYQALLEHEDEPS